MIHFDNFLNRFLQSKYEELLLNKRERSKKIIIEKYPLVGALIPYMLDENLEVPFLNGIRFTRSDADLRELIGALRQYNDNASDYKVLLEDVDKSYKLKELVGSPVDFVNKIAEDTNYKNNISNLLLAFSVYLQTEQSEMFRKASEKYEMYIEKNKHKLMNSIHIDNKKATYLNLKLVSLIHHKRCPDCIKEFIASHRLTALDVLFEKSLNVPGCNRIKGIYLNYLVKSLGAYYRFLVDSTDESCYAFDLIFKEAKINKVTSDSNYKEVANSCNIVHLSDILMMTDVDFDYFTEGSYTLRLFKEDILKYPEKYRKAHNLAGEKVALPVVVTDDPWDVQLHNTLQIIHKYLQNRNPLLAEGVKQHFFDGIEYGKITVWRKSHQYNKIKLHKEFSEVLLKGEEINDGISLNKDLLCMIDPKSILYKPTNYSDSFLYYFCSGLTSANILDGKVRIVVEDTYEAERTTDHAINALSEIVVPELKSTIKDKIKERVINDTYSRKPLTYREGLVNALLENEVLVDTFDDGRVSIVNEYLKGVPQRILRVISLQRAWLSTDAIKTIYKQTFNENKNMVMTKVKNSYPDTVHNLSNQWIYYEGLDDFKTAEGLVAKCIKELNYEFTWKDIVTLVTKTGYMGALQESSLRTYVTKVCVIDSNDSNHFCHIKHKSEFPQYNWLAKRKTGMTNAVLNFAYEMLKKKTTPMTIDSVRSNVQNYAKTEGFDKHNSMGVVYLYTRDNNDDVTQLPFVTDGKLIWVDKNVCKDINWALIGTHSKYPIETSEIIWKVQNFLTRKKDYSASLADIVKYISLLEDFSHMPQSAIRKVFDENRLPDIFTRTTSNSNVIVGLDIKKFDDEDVEDNKAKYVAAEPDAKKSNTQTNTGVTEPNLVPASPIMLQLRDPIGTEVNWDKLEKTISKEIAFYEKDYAGISSAKVVHKFAEYMKNSENGGLNDHIPYGLYSYFCSQSNSKTRYHCLTDIITYYEGLLKDIYFRKYPQSKGRKFSGLDELCYDGYPEFYSVYSKPYFGLTTFQKVFKDLHSKRNPHAHGEFLEMTSITLAQMIVKYLALYVYTVETYT